MQAEQEDKNIFAEGNEQLFKESMDDLAAEMDAQKPIGFSGELKDGEGRTVTVFNGLIIEVE